MLKLLNPKRFLTARTDLLGLKKLKGEPAARAARESGHLSAKASLRSELQAEGGDGAPLAHGGDLAAARRAFPRAPQPWLDLSTGVNPYPYPFQPPPAEALTRLPEPASLAELEACAAAAFAAAAHASVVAAAGTQAIIGWLPHLVAARSVGVLGFTYAEHARAWAQDGARVEAVEELAALTAHDVGVLVNPNNPDGRLLPVERLRETAEAFRRRGGLLVVDEAFGDFLDGASLAPVLPASGALVLRSFGKTFGLPGLRLGFAVAAADVAPRLRAALGPWPVSGLAVAIGRQALADRGWRAAMGERLRGEAEKFDALLAKAGLDVIGRAPLFRLIEAHDAQHIFTRLAQAGVLTRRFPQKPSWLRLAIPAGEGARARLSVALALS